MDDNCDETDDDDDDGDDDTAGVAVVVWLGICLLRLIVISSFV